MTAFKRISIPDAKQLIDQGNVAIVDIRDAMSYNNGHIEDAFLLDNSNIDQFIDMTPAATPILIYCYHGNSSQSAGQFLAEKGFTEVYSMDGGYEMWKTLSS